MQVKISESWGRLSVPEGIIEGLHFPMFRLCILSLHPLVVK